MILGFAVMLILSVFEERIIHYSAGKIPGYAGKIPGYAGKIPGYAGI